MTWRARIWDQVVAACRAAQALGGPVPVAQVEAAFRDAARAAKRSGVRGVRVEAAVRALMARWGREVAPRIRGVERAGPGLALYDRLVHALPAFDAAHHRVSVYRDSRDPDFGPLTILDETLPTADAALVRAEIDKVLADFRPARARCVSVERVAPHEVGIKVEVLLGAPRFRIEARIVAGGTGPGPQPATVAVDAVEE